MTRSGAVTAAGVIGILGCLATLILAGVTILSAAVTGLAPPAADQPVPPISPMWTLIIMSVVYLAFTVWGAVSTVGLFRLRNWARLSFIVFSAMLTVLSACGVLGVLVAIPIVRTQALTDPDVPPGVITAVVVGMLAIVLCALSIGVWWLVLFNLLRVKMQFSGGESPSPVEGRLPTRLTVVAWILIASGLALPIHLVMVYPVPMLGMIVRGWPGRVIVVTQLLVAVVAGVGLLRKRLWGHTLASALYAFGILNLVVTLVAPGSLARLRGVYLELVAQGRMPAAYAGWIMWLGTVVGLFVALVILWLLMSRRRAFTDICAAASPVEEGVA